MTTRLGPQGRAVLREQPPELRLVTETAADWVARTRDVEGAGRADPGRPAGLGVLGVPAIAAASIAASIAADLEAARVAALEREAAELRLRVHELEHELRIARRSLDEAREAGARSERVRNVRTMRGRLTSILMVGGGDG